MQPGICLLALLCAVSAVSAHDERYKGEGYFDKDDKDHDKYQLHYEHRNYGDSPFGRDPFYRPEQQEWQIPDYKKYESDEIHYNIEHHHDEGYYAPKGHEPPQCHVRRNLTVPASPSNRYNTSYSQAQIPTYCGNRTIYNAEQFIFNPPCNATYTFSTCGTGGSQQDTILAIAGGCNNYPELNCNDNVNATRFGACADPLDSTIQRNLTQGVVYYVTVGNKSPNGVKAAGTISVFQTSPTTCPQSQFCPPFNIECKTQGLAYPDEEVQLRCTVGYYIQKDPDLYNRVHSHNFEHHHRSSVARDYNFPDAQLTVTWTPQLSLEDDMYWHPGHDPYILEDAQDSIIAGNTLVVNNIRFNEKQRESFAADFLVAPNDPDFVEKINVTLCQQFGPSGATTCCQTETLQIGIVRDQEEYNGPGQYNNYHKYKEEYGHQEKLTEQEQHARYERMFGNDANNPAIYENNEERLRDWETGERKEEEKYYGDGGYYEEDSYYDAPKETYYDAPKEAYYGKTGSKGKKNDYYRHRV